MTLLLHGRDVTADATEGLRPSGSAETTTDLLLDLHHPQIPLGQVIIEGHSKIMHKRQGLFPVLHQSVQQILTFALFLAPPLATWGRRIVAFLFHAGLQDGPVALLGVS